LLVAGGRLLVIDFAPHEREELRTRDAHARLGFADEAVLKWMDAAGLDAHVVEHLEGGELTRSEEHTSELPSLMRISYAVFCLKKKTKHNKTREREHNME